MDSTNWTYSDYHKHFFHDVKPEDLDREDPCCAIGQVLKQTHPNICEKTWTYLHCSIEKFTLFPLFKAAVLAQSQGKKSFFKKIRFTSHLSSEGYQFLLYHIHGLSFQSKKLYSFHPQTSPHLHCQCTPCIPSYKKRLEGWEFENIQLPTSPPFPLKDLQVLRSETFAILQNEALKKGIPSKGFTRENMAIATSFLQKLQKEAIKQRALSNSFWTLPWKKDIPIRNLWRLSEEQFLQLMAKVLLSHWGLLIIWPSDEDTDLLFCSFAPNSPELRFTLPQSTKEQWNRRQEKKRGGLRLQLEDGSTLFASKQLVKNHCGSFLGSLKNEKGNRFIKAPPYSKKNLELLLSWAHGVPLSSEDYSCAELYSLAHFFKVGALLRQFHDKVALGMTYDHLRRIICGWTGQRGTENLFFLCIALAFSTDFLEYKEVIQKNITEPQYAAWRTFKDSFSSDQLDSIWKLTQQMNPNTSLKKEDTILDQLQSMDRFVRDQMWNRCQKQLGTDLELEITTRKGKETFFAHQSVLQALPKEALEKIKKQRGVDVKGLTVPNKNSFSLFLEFFYRRAFPPKTRGTKLTAVYQIAVDLDLPDIQKELTDTLHQYISVSSFKTMWKQWVPGTQDLWMKSWLQFLDQKGGMNFKKTFIQNLCYEKAMAVEELGPWNRGLKNWLEEVKDELRYFLIDFPYYFGEDTEKVKNWLGVSHL